MPARSDALSRQYDDNGRIWAVTIGLSVLCHLIFFSGFVFLPKLSMSRNYIPSTVEVDLVSLPQPGPVGSAGPKPVPQPEAKIDEPKAPVHKPEPVKQEKKPAETVPTKPKETVSLAPQKIEVKKSIKQQTYDASRVIKSAIEKIEKEAPASRPHSVREAIDKLKKDVESQTGVVMREGAASGGTGKKAVELIDIYNAEIWHKITQNWAYSEAVAGGGYNWEAVVSVKIMKNGDIRELWFETRSGNAYFDDSVLKAIKKSDPLPPLPESFPGPYYEVGFRFNLSELRGGF